MSTRLLCILFLLFTSRLCIGQVSYDEISLKQFVAVYMDTKSTITNVVEDQRIQDLLTKYDVSPQQYRVISKNRLTKLSSLEANERELLANIRKLDADHQNAKREQISVQCRAHNLPLETFIEIKTKYASDISFQRSLQPYFRQYINSKKQ